MGQGAVQFPITPYCLPGPEVAFSCLLPTFITRRYLTLWSVGICLWVQTILRETESWVHKHIQHQALHVGNTAGERREGAGPAKNWQTTGSYMGRPGLSPKFTLFLMRFLASQIHTQASETRIKEAPDSQPGRTDSRMKGNWQVKTWGSWRTVVWATRSYSHCLKLREYHGLSKWGVNALHWIKICLQRKQDSFYVAFCKCAAHRI